MYGGGGARKSEPSLAADAKRFPREIDKEGAGEVAHRYHCGEKPVEARLVVSKSGGVLFNLARYAQHIGADDLPALREVRPGDLDGIVHNAIDPGRENRVQSTFDGNRCKSRHKNNGEQRNEAEDACDLEVKSSARRLPAARSKQLSDLKADDADNDEYQSGRHPQRAQDNALCGDDGGKVAQDQERRNAR